jgi:hypothetical protein
VSFQILVLSSQQQRTLPTPPRPSVPFPPSPTPPDLPRGRSARPPYGAVTAAHAGDPAHHSRRLPMRPAPALRSSSPWPPPLRAQARHHGRHLPYPELARPDPKSRGWGQGRRCDERGGKEDGAHDAATNMM